MALKYTADVQHMILYSKFLVSLSDMLIFITSGLSRY